MKQKSDVWDHKWELYCIRQGTIEGVFDNIRDALDKHYYKQLKKKTTGYKEFIIRNYFKNLNE